VNEREIKDSAYKAFQLLGGGVVLLAAVLFAVFMGLLVADPPRHVAYAQTNYTNCETARQTTTLLGATTGTSATQLVALVAGDPIYVCSVIVVGTSGTNPTFSLVYGTGTNCGTGQHTFLPAFATAASAPVSFGGHFVGAVPAGNALCYLGGGTTPVQSYIIAYAQG
jgi:hypothetical protein